MIEANYITKSGADRLLIELHDLKHNARYAIANDIANATKLGDLSENAEYHSAKKKQSQIESRIRYLDSFRSKMTVVDIDRLDQTVINFGATVQLLNLANNQTAFFTLLSEYEVDVLNNVISVLSPLGFQLMGKVVGDIIEVTIPKGQIEYEVIGFEFKT